MNTPKPLRRSRQQQAEEIRQRLLDAAFDVFCAKGFHAGTVDEVAAAAGLTTGAVYSRYSGKAELVLALVERTLETRIADFKRQLELGDLEFGSQAERRWVDQAIGYSARPGWGLLALELRILAARDPALAERYTAIHWRYLEAMADLIEGSFAANGLTTTERPIDLARIIAALASGMVLDGVTHEGKPNVDLTARALRLLQRSAVTDEPSRGAGPLPV